MCAKPVLAARSGGDGSFEVIAGGDGRQRHTIQVMSYTDRNKYENCNVHNNANDRNNSNSRNKPKASKSKPFFRQEKRWLEATDQECYHKSVWPPQNIARRVSAEHKRNICLSERRPGVSCENYELRANKIDAILLTAMWHI